MKNKSPSKTAEAVKQHWITGQQWSLQIYLFQAETELLWSHEEVSWFNQWQVNTLNKHHTTKIWHNFVRIISPEVISVCAAALYSSGRPGMGNWPAKASTSALISATRCWNFSPWPSAWMNSFRVALGPRLLCTSKVSSIPAGERRAGRTFRSQIPLCNADMPQLPELWKWSSSEVWIRVANSLNQCKWAQNTADFTQNVKVNWLKLLNVLQLSTIRSKHHWNRNPGNWMFLPKCSLGVLVDSLYFYLKINYFNLAC